MTFDELLVEFRALGGVADNVCLGEGRRGRGIFVIDPSEPATLHCPERLLVPVDELDLRNGRMVIKPESSVGTHERAFFDRTMRHFGWDAGARDEIWKAQTQWSTLPGAVPDAIRAMGTPQDLDLRFLAPSDEVCAQLYVRARHVSYRGRQHLMPLVDMVNHSSGANPYVIEGGVGVTGTFESEMLVRYNLSDTWKRAIGHGFVDRALHAHSVSIALDTDGVHVAIGRDTTALEVQDGLIFPRVKREGNAFQLPFLVLGDSRMPDVPRAVFRKIFEGTLSVARADAVFDNVAHFNRTKFLDLLRTLQAYDGPIITMLEEAAIGQLEVLSACIGARAL